MTQSLNLYIHIPFCATKCFYCAFFSQEGQEKWINPYVNALLREIELTGKTAQNWQIKTIYIGGGTPSLIPAEKIGAILRAIQEHFVVDSLAEITIEANPESITDEKLLAYHEVGCNRLSIGLQAWQSRLLTDMNRPYQIADFEKIIQKVQQGPIKNFNLDLIFGLPNQSLVDWRESLTNTIACHPKHISCYSLELDNHSKFGRLWKSGKFNSASTTIDRQMYSLTTKLLSESGYLQYEISNFAQPGFECQHNLAFWHNQPYLGLGAGAESYWQGKGWQNIANLRQYCESLKQSLLPRQAIISEKKMEKAQAELALGLRLTTGISLQDFRQKYHTDLIEWLQPSLKNLMAKKLLINNDTHLRLSSKGKDVINQVLIELLSATETKTMMPIVS